MFANEVVVVEVGIGGVDPRDLFVLPGAERFVGVEAPDSFEQTLAAQGFVKTGYASGELIGSVEERRVGVGDLDASFEELRRNVRLGANDSMAFIEKLYGATRPYGPMAEKAADDAALDGLSIHLKGEWRNKIEDDVVVVAGVESDVASRVGDAAEHVERLIAVERSDFDSDDIFDFRETAPEGVRKNAAADSGLQVEANDGNDLRDGARVGKELGVRCIFERGETQEASVIAKIGE